MSFEFTDKDRILEVYNYDESTGEYLNTATLKVEAHTGLPAHSTCENLPELLTGQIAVFQVNKWEVLTDNRGVIWDTTTKEQTGLTELGSIPEGKTDLEPNEFDTWDGEYWVVNKTEQLESTKLSATNSVQEFATQCRTKITGAADQYKLAGWNDKAQRAHRVLSNTPLGNDLSILQVECDKRGRNETPLELATKHTQKAERLAIAISVVDGLESKGFEMLSTKRSVNTINQLLGELKIEAEEELGKLI